jgi:hypothetical protein
MSTVQPGTRGRRSPADTRGGEKSEPKTPGSRENIIRGVRARRRFSHGSRGRWSPFPPLKPALAYSRLNVHYRREIAMITYDQLPTPYWWEPQKSTRRGHCTRPRRNPRRPPWPEDRTRPGEPR